MMNQLCTHPNVGGALLLSLGCESFHRHRLAENIAKTGRPVSTVVIQQTGAAPRSSHAPAGVPPLSRSPHPAMTTHQPLVHAKGRRPSACPQSTR
ncbi:MAG TPA: UxaA family hydrolase, partial [Hyphomicrobiaceae bacterium]|nr:UxaA family hydrolase [Hyphomicrobiaceae bacterium]